MSHPLHGWQLLSHPNSSHAVETTAMLSLRNLPTFLLSLLASTTHALPSPADSTTAISFPLPSDLLSNPLYGSPPNDFSCRSSLHPNPVILLHGLSSNREYPLNQLARHLISQSYCVYSLTYGAHALAPWLGGVKSMRASAAEIASFVRDVLARTGASKVDLVGHSEGGVMAVYVPMTQPGVAALVDHTVALGPAIHGAQYFGLTPLAYVGGEVTRELAAAALKVLGCQACDDMATGGEVYEDFRSNEGHIIQEGNKATIVMSTADTLVSPAVSRIDEEGVRNVIVQDSCPDDRVGHIGLALDKGIWGLVENALTEDYTRRIECEMGLPI